MDIWLNPSQSKEDSSKCDFCYQSGITVKPLSCSRHFYCGVCEKFAPKFYKRSDYTCSRCSGLPKSHHHRINLDLSPTTLNSQSSKKKHDFKEVTIAVEGGNILSFGDPDADSGDDLEGNNTEWDQLLQSLTAAQNISKKTPEPLVKNSVSSKGTSGVQTPAGVGQSTGSRDKVFGGSHRQSTCPGSNSVGDRNQEEATEEQERGSSPVKGRRKRYPHYDAPAFETPEEEEDFSPIGDVEGPDLSRGSVSDDDGYQGGSEDEFWAF